MYLRESRRANRERSTLTTGHQRILAALHLPEPARYFDFTASD